MPAPVSDLDIVARTVWGEARGEGETGMRAVACVVVTRARLAREHRAATGKKHPLFGDGTLAGACLVKFQFSCWNEHDPNLAKLKAVGIPDSAFIAARVVAYEAVNGHLPDTTNGATHYMAYRDFAAARVGHWSQRMMVTERIGGHVFMREPDHG